MDWVDEIIAKRSKKYLETLLSGWGSSGIQVQTVNISEVLARFKLPTDIESVKKIIQFALKIGAKSIPVDEKQIMVPLLSILINKKGYPALTTAYVKFTKDKDEAIRDICILVKIGGKKDANKYRGNSITIGDSTFVVIKNVEKFFKKYNEGNEIQTENDQPIGNPTFSSGIEYVLLGSLSQEVVTMDDGVVVPPLNSLFGGVNEIARVSVSQAYFGSNIIAPVPYCEISKYAKPT